MKSIGEFESVFLHRDPVDMRKSIQGLCEIVQLEGMGEWMRPSLFVFSGKRRSAIKILYFDRSGFCLWQKKLDREKFPWPKRDFREVISISTEQLEWLLQGYDVWRMRPFSEVKFEKIC